MKKHIIINTVKKNLVPSGDYIFGFADLHGLLDAKFNGFNFGISIGRKLDDRIIDPIENGPTLEYYDYYNLVNFELAELTRKIQDDLGKIGVDSIITKPTISSGAKGNEKYEKTLTYDISHKMVATRAGLGWIGKTDLFISKTFGPRLRLVSILTRQNPGINSTPIEVSKCGKCNVCVEKCPAQAATGELWNIHIHRDNFFDAYKCREKCGQLARERLHIDKRICGICVSICPIGKRNKNKLHFLRETTSQLVYPPHIS